MPQPSRRRAPGSTRGRHDRAFASYRDALIDGCLPELIAHDRIDGHAVRDWRSMWAAHPLPPEALDVALALLKLRDGEAELLDFADHAPVDAPAHCGALVSAPGWQAVWSRQEHPRHFLDGAPSLDGAPVAVIEQVVIGLRRQQDLWRVTSSLLTPENAVDGAQPAPRGVRPRIG